MPELLLISLYITGGLALLYFGADWLVKGAITLALYLGLSPTINGLNPKCNDSVIAPFTNQSAPK